MTANDGSLTISSTSTVTTQFTVTKVPTGVHTFVTWAPDTSDSNVAEASLLLNPASAASDTNLFGLAVNSLPKFIVDAEGDVFAKSVTLSGGATLASTTISGTLTIEANTFLGDAPNNDSTVIKGITSIYATSTSPALSIWNSTPTGSLLSLSTGATAPTSIFRVGADGRTTIGTTTASGLSILTLTSTTTDSIPLTIKGVNSQSASLLSILSSTDQSYLTLSSSGLLGLSSSSPSQLLSVHGNSYVSGTSFFGGAITGTSTASFGTTTVTNLISTNVSTSTFAGGVESPYLNLTGISASSTVSGGFQTGGLSSSNGLTLTGGSILASAVNALIGSTTITNLTVTNIGTSTFSGGLEIAQLHTTTGTSTFSNGIQLSAGCFRDISGTCLGPVTLGGSNTNVQFNNNGVLGGDASFIWDSLAKRFGLGTSSPSSLLSVHGNSYISGTGFFGGAITGTSTASFGTTTVTNLISTNVSMSTFAGGIESPYLSLTGTAASSTVLGGFQTAGLSSSKGLTLTGGSFLASAVNALIGSTTVTNLTISNTSSSTFAGPITHSAGDLIVARGGSGNLLLNPYGGNIGVGTTSPAARLHVQNMSGDAIMRIEGSSTNSGYINFRDANGTNSNIFIGSENSAGGNILGNSSAYNAVFGTANARGLQLGTNNSVRLTIDSGGNVGVGTTSPSSFLALTTASGIDTTIGLAHGNEFWRMGVTATGGAEGVTGNRFIIKDMTTGAGVRLLIDSSGNVGIGTTSPAAVLSIVSSSNSFPDSFGNNLKLNGAQPALWFKESDGNRGYFLGLDGGVLNFGRETRTYLKIA